MPFAVRKVIEPKSPHPQLGYRFMGLWRSVECRGAHAQQRATSIYSTECRPTFRRMLTGCSVAPHVQLCTQKHCDLFSASFTVILPHTHILNAVQTIHLSFMPSSPFSLPLTKDIEDLSPPFLTRLVSWAPF